VWGGGTTVVTRDLCTYLYFVLCVRDNHEGHTRGTSAEADTIREQQAEVDAIREQLLKWMQSKSSS